jgi:BASS family bile acid:Na+ symporter
MTDTLQRLADISVLAFVVLSMLAMGMSQSLAAVVSALRDLRTVAAALAINFGIAPLLAVLLTRLVPLEPAHAIGLLLLGSAAGAPFLPKLVEIAGGNLAYSVALMILQMVGTIVFMPLALPWLVPGLNADPVSIAMPLVILMLIPLATGFMIAIGGSGRIQRLHGLVHGAANAAFLLLVFLLIGLNLETLAGTVGSFAIGTYAVFVLVMVGVGYAFGRGDPAEKTVSALGAGQRNIAAAMVVASAGFGEPQFIVMLLVASIVGLVVLLMVAKAMRRLMARVKA